MPFSNVVISNQLTGKTGRREVEENHLNLRPRHGSPAAEGGQGCRPGWQLGSILRSRWRIVQWGGRQGESQGGVRVGRPPRSASFKVNCAECWDEEVCECGGNQGEVIVADGASSSQEFTHTHVQANDRRSRGIERCYGLVRECPSLSSAANQLPPPPLRGHGTPRKTDTWTIELSIPCLCVKARVRHHTNERVIDTMSQ